MMLVELDKLDDGDVRFEEMSGNYIEHWILSQTLFESLLIYSRVEHRALSLFFRIFAYVGHEGEEQ